MKKKMDNRIKKNVNPPAVRAWNVSKIRDKSVGEVLEETRREQNLSLGAAAESLNIHRNHLLALESGDYEKLPGGVYSEKILKSYADLLNIDFESLKKKFDKEADAARIIKKQTFASRLSQKNFIVTPRLIEIALIAVAVTLLLVYLGLEINNIFAPPPLSVASPLDNSITSESRVEISGKSAKEVKVKINDQEIQTDTEGNFQESVILQPGLNVIKISAVKKRSRENVIYRQVILK